MHAHKIQHLGKKKIKKVTAIGLLILLQMCSSNLLKNKLKLASAVKLLGILFRCFMELTKNK